MPITLTSRYKPLTYDEITRPLIEQTQVQDAMEDAYMQAQEAAAQVMAQANEQTDPESHAKLRNYANFLQQQADNLMRQGLNRNSKASLLNARRRYSQEIIPIENAAKRRMELHEERRKAGPDFLWEKDILSLDDLVRNPMADYGSYYNGQMITKRVAEAVSAAAKGMASYEATGHLTPYHIKILERHGFTPEEIANAVAGGQDGKSRFLQGIRDRILGSIDVYNKGNEATRTRALDYANEGFYAGIGEVRFGHINDEAALAELNWKYRKKELNYQESLRRQREQEAQRQALLNIQPRFQTRQILTDAEHNAQISNFTKANEFIEKGFLIKKPDGTYDVTDLGRKALEEGMQTENAAAYNAGVNMKVYAEGEHPGHLGREAISGSGSFYDFMVYDTKSYSKKTAPRGGKHSYYSVDSKALTRAIGAATDNSYDAYLTHEYKRTLPASSYKDVAGFIHSITNSDGEVYGYTMVNENGRYALKGGSNVDADDISESTIKSAATVNGKAGDYLELSLKNGKKVRIPLGSFDRNAEVMLQGNHGTIESYVEALKNGYLITETGIPIVDAITAEINSMGDNSISIFGVYNPVDTKVDNTYQTSTTSTY